MGYRRNRDPDGLSIGAPVRLFRFLEYLGSGYRRVDHCKFVGSGS
jgi:hypothetical protein